MIGQTISHYKILEKLGEGGMGVVYKAEDLTLGRTVALKFLPPDSVAREEDRARLVHEARAAAALLHPNICPIHEISEAEGRTFIAMACIEGRSLKDRIDDGPLPLDEALSLARQLGDALASAHAKGIIHRDIKPANIMLTAEGRPMLMDFGLAKVSGTTKLTRTGTTMGTVAYMSPEQVQGREADHRSDIWALGVVLYEMVSGRAPFGGDYEAAMLYSILNEDPEPLAVEGGDIPAGLDGIIAKALAKDPGHRYQGAAELVADLDALARDSEALPAGKAVPAKGLKRQWRRWRPWQRAAAAGAALAVIAGFLWLVVTIWSGQEGTIDSIGVLPLVNLSGDSEKEYLAEGVTEQLNTKLGAAMGTQVRVVSQQTMRQFKDSKESMPEIGRRIRVKALVEGSLIITGDRVQIMVKLIDAAKDRIIWSEPYEGLVSDILNLQSEIVQTIGTKVGVRLTDDARAELARREAVDPRAYEAFLRGRYLVNMGTVESLKSGIEKCNEALRIDPHYAAPWAVLVDAYFFLIQVASLPDQELKGLVQQAGRRVEEVAPGSWVAEYILANIAYDEWDWEAAGRHFERALRLNPNEAGVHLIYGQYLMNVNRKKEALEHIIKSYQLDPLSAFVAANVGFQLWGLKRYDEAFHQAEEALLLDKNNWVAHWLKGAIYIDTGRYREAVVEIENSRRLLGVPGYAVAGHLGYTRAKLGDRSGAEALVKELEENSVQQRVDPVLAATIYAGLGRTDEAFASLESGFRERSTTLITLLSRNWPGWRELENDPRFADLMRRTGLYRYYSSRI